MSQENEVLAMEGRRNSSFATAMVRAAESAFRDGDITRLQLVAVRLASKSPKAVAKCREAAEEQLVFEKGVPVSGLGDIDWNAWLAFIKEILPIIIQIISLF